VKVTIEATPQLGEGIPDHSKPWRLWTVTGPDGARLSLFVTEVSTDDEAGAAFARALGLTEDTGARFANLHGRREFR
jgi:hypothetical protein